MQNETIDYKQKYLKYKTKYLDLKNNVGGGWWFNSIFSWSKSNKNKQALDKFFKVLLFFNNLNESSNVSLHLSFEGLGLYYYKHNNNNGGYLFEDEDKRKIIFYVSDEEIKYRVDSNNTTPIFINKNKTGALFNKCTFYKITYNDKNMNHEHHNLIKFT